MTLRPWVALGIDLRFLVTEEGGRSKPLASEPYMPLQYRPNWRLPGMSDREQAGAPVLCFGTFPVGPGDATAAVIVPLATREPFDSLSGGGEDRHARRAASRRAGAGDLDRGDGDTRPR